jgi:hypothetical protein
MCGVVAAAQDQAVEQVAHAYPLAGAEAEQRLGGDRVVGRRPYDLSQRQLAQRQIGGHQLRRAGHRGRAVRLSTGQYLAGATVDQHPGAGVELRRRGLRGLALPVSRAGCEQRKDHQAGRHGDHH